MDTKNKEHLICDHCGKQDETVKYVTCPYTQEIHDIIEMSNFCDNCLYAAYDDI